MIKTIPDGVTKGPLTENKLLAEGEPLCNQVGQQGRLFEASFANNS
jgi:hypothetical protein